ncbi:MULTISPECIES: KTSC domain-containing protein [unclassified Rhizobium]|uniref:KTSC domain-containing protein n=1 Tax=Rhizobium TaxID=379 RepID=UPI00084CE0DB|nr:MULTISPECIES: KTSC domain-containing protein [unclassified Rhizobium]OEC95459.1 KTSC domain-containing protein [Rhizobium sp. YK2]QYA15071.1 KTSC domain-containing protein [Rhizobium sp. AB2/73]UEQ84063.1 KTSC domain-containing protein [Rhizobium sp. AB2/73]
MQELPVSSKIIKSVYFRPDDGRLYIRFKNGEERQFTGVPQKVAIAMVKAPSPGQHYIEHIRTQFERVA